MRAQHISKRATGASAAILLALALQVAPASAQFTAVPVNRAWAETFGGLGSDWIQALAARADGGMFFAGRTSSFGHGEDLWVASLDRRGRTIWELALSINDSDEALALLATPDGGCLVAGVTNTFGSAELSEGWIVKLDASGGITWQKTYGSPDDEQIRALALSPDGYYAAGTIQDGVGADPWVLELDADGNILWQERFPAPGFDFLASLTATDTGVAFVANSNSEFPTSPGVSFTRPWLVNLDGDGNPLWQRTYNISGGDGWGEIRALDDGGFIAVGEALAFAFFRGDAWVVRLDDQGAVVWERRFGDNFGNFNFDGALAVRPTAEGGFAVFAGTLTARDGLWLLQLDGAGNLQWDRSYGVGSFQNAAAFDIAPNGDRLLAGVFFSQTGDADSFVLRLTPNGRGPLGCELSNPTDPNMFSFPPETDVVTQAPAPSAHVAVDSKAIQLPVSSGRFLCNSVGG